ncbi:hypothetical protein [Sulfuriferula sp. AH1]|uniref:hypothetical protein n=1 Tax=Sulfuriferula sp. AH1 TaxID=1985873 RepID=UPI000B3B7F27|nr:hypothetical protein [Sulfuriferula sp. AH1]
MSEFETRLDGLLYSLLSWDQLTAFWPRVDVNAGWYLYAVGQNVPDAPASGQQVSDFIQQIDALLRKEHEEKYCGIVYADDLQSPQFIVIYDPHHLGVSCGSSKDRVLPGWVMSQVAPTDLQPRIVPNNRKRWWENFLGEKVAE